MSKLVQIWERYGAVQITVTDWQTKWRERFGAQVKGCPGGRYSRVSQHQARRYVDFELTPATVDLLLDFAMYAEKGEFLLHAVTFRYPTELAADIAGAPNVRPGVCGRRAVKDLCLNVERPGSGVRPLAERLRLAVEGLMVDAETWAKVEALRAERTQWAAQAEEASRQRAAAARVAAAAPDLLQALRLIIGQEDGVGGLSVERLRIARAAIAKAEGSAA